MTFPSIICAIRQVGARVMAALRGPLRLLAMPWFLLRLASGAKSFRDNPLLGARCLNRMGLHVWRIRLSQAFAGYRRRSLARHVPLELRLRFEKDGFVVIEQFLPEGEFVALRKGLVEREWPAREQTQGDTVTRRIAMDPGLLAAVPEARSLLRNPLWRALTRFVGSHDAEPLVYVQSILNRVCDAPPDPQLQLHADTFHPSMKAWLFLTDVAEDGGAFRYVPGSHRMSPARLAWEKARSLDWPQLDSLSQRGSLRIDEADLPKLGLPPPATLAVSANTLVVADTSGFHARGLSVGSSVRVEVWAYQRQTPFVPWCGLHLLSLAGLAERRIVWTWRLQDMIRRLGIKSHPWSAVGPKRPDDPGPGAV